jgi:hypothetical protein
MTRYRKHVLTAVFALLAAYYAGPWLMQAVLRGPLASRRAQGQRFERLIAEKERELARLRQAGQQLAAWEAQSLPANPEVARSLYQAWLVELADHVGLVHPTFESGAPTVRKGAYHLFSFTVAGRGTVEQLTRFLFEFYRAGHLHQIRSLELTPAGKGGALELSFTIEALALAGLPRTDRLGTAAGASLAFDRLDDYRVIARRNLFAPGSGDAAAHVRLTAVTSSDDEPVAWFSLDARGETLKLRAGEPLELDGLRAEIVAVEGADVIFERAGQRWLLTVGESLDQASALPPDFGP